MLLLTTAYSQDFNANIYGGLSATQLDGDTYSGFNKAGLIIGGNIYRYFNKKWNWQMGLRYVQKGSKYSNTKTSKYYKCQLHYLEVPLIINYKHFKKVSFDAGISLGYLIKALEDKDGYGLIDATPPFNNFEFASIIGVNYHFTDKLSVGAHISYSLMAIRAYSSGYSTFMDGGQHNSSIYFALYYKLPSL
jgi:hypothetical protein